MLFNAAENHVHESPDAADGDHAGDDDVCGGQGKGMGDHVADAGQGTGQHLCRDQAHPGNAQADAHTRDNDRHGRRDQNFPENLALGGSQDPGGIKEGGVHAADPVYGGGKDGVKGPHKDNEEHRELYVVQVDVPLADFHSGHGGQAGDAEPGHDQRHPGQRGDRPEKIQKSVKSFKNHAVISHDHPKRDGDSYGHGITQQDPDQADQDIAGEGPHTDQVFKGMSQDIQHLLHRGQDDLIVDPGGHPYPAQGQEDGSQQGNGKGEEFHIM